MNKAYDIIVGGGGNIGLVMAAASAYQGLNVALVDEGVSNILKNSQFDGRAYALSPATIKMLNVLGIWKELVDSAQPILSMKVSDGIAGSGAFPFYMNFDHRDMESGPIAYMVEERFLKTALWNKVLSYKNISKIFDSKIVSQNINSGLISVHFENKSKIFGKLLVGADGRQSTVAEHSGIKRDVHNYHQTSIVCAVSHEKDHFGEAHQFFMPAGPLAILPLQNKVSSIVWTECKDNAENLKGLSSNDFLAELKTRFGSFRGRISLLSDRNFFPLSLSLSKSLVAQRVALVGDAAHAVHPIAGQGLNLGMRDVASLVEILTVARRCGEDIGSIDVLSRYSAWRDLDRLTLSSFTHIINKAFSNDNLILRMCRGIGMGVINRMPKLRGSLMNEASGQGNDLPVLMSGRPI